MCYAKREVDVSTPKPIFLFDTHAVVKQFENSGKYFTSFCSLSPIPQLGFHVVVTKYAVAATRAPILLSYWPVTMVHTLSNNKLACVLLSLQLKALPIPYFRLHN